MIGSVCDRGRSWRRVRLFGASKLGVMVERTTNIEFAVESERVAKRRMQILSQQQKYLTSARRGREDGKAQPVSVPWASPYRFADSLKTSTSPLHLNLQVSHSSDFRIVISDVTGEIILLILIPLFISSGSSGFKTAMSILVTEHCVRARSP